MSLFEDRINFMIKNKDATKIVINSPEIAYLPKELDPAGIIKTGDGGGLAVVIAAKVEEAYRIGIDVHVTIPEYYDLFKRQSNLSDKEFEEALTLVAMHPNVHFIDDGIFLHADKVYGDTSYALSRMDIRRAVNLTKGIVRTGKELNRTYPEADKIFQLNDWATALAAAGLKEYDYFKKIKTEMVWHSSNSHVRPLHKLNEHGYNTQRYHKRLFYTNDFPSDDHGHDMYRLWVDFLTSGFLTADHITAVGENIHKEAINGRLENIAVEFKDIGGGKFENVGVMPKYMADMLRYRNSLGEAGVVSNEPSRISDPAINPWLTFNYGTDNILEGKRVAQEEFQKDMGLDVDPKAKILLWPHRLFDPQKGAQMFIELNEEFIDKYAQDHLQIAYVAGGDSTLVNMIKERERRRHGKIAIKPFTNKRSETGKAAAKGLAMPSLFEPRGFPQLEGPRFGTWPIVYRSVDGVISHDRNSEHGNGWSFDDHNYDGLRYSIHEWMKFWRLPIDVIESNLKRAREENLKEHNVEKMLQKSIETWEYMLDKSGNKKLILRTI